MYLNQKALSIVAKKNKCIDCRELYMVFGKLQELGTAA